MKIIIKECNIYYLVLKVDPLPHPLPHPEHTTVRHHENWGFPAQEEPAPLNIEQPSTKPYS